MKNVTVTTAATAVKRAVPVKTEATVILSFRLPQRLIDRIDIYAERETRNRVNMVQVLLQDALNARDMQDASAIPLVAQDTGRKLRR